MLPNQWYAILESREVKKGKPVGVMRMGEKLVAWRDGRGQVTVMADKCPHRGAALSVGKLTDERPRRGTHEATGNCQRCSGQYARQPERPAGDDPRQRLEQPNPKWELVGGPDAADEEASLGVHVPSHFQRDHAPERGPADEAGSARVQRAGHPLGVRRQGVVRRRLQPVGHGQTLQRGSLVPKKPPISSQPWDQYEWWVAGHSTTAPTKRIAGPRTGARL